MKARFVDDVGPVINDPPPNETSNIVLTTTSELHTRDINLVVTDSNSIKPGSLVIRVLEGNGVVSHETYNSDTNTITFTVTTDKDHYTANSNFVYNSFVDNRERFEITIRDDETTAGNLSQPKIVEYFVKVQDVTPPVVTLQGNNPSFQYGSTDNSATNTIRFRVQDTHTGLDMQSIRLIGDLIPIIYVPNLDPLAPTFDEIVIDEDDRIDNPNTTQFSQEGTDYDSIITFEYTLAKPATDNNLIVQVEVKDKAGNPAILIIPIEISFIDNQAPSLSDVTVPNGIVELFTSEGREKVVNVTFITNDDATLKQDIVCTPVKESAGDVMRMSILPGAVLNLSLIHI